MKWYGLFNNSIQSVINKKSNSIIKRKKTLVTKTLYINLNFYKTIFHIPNYWNLLILTSKKNNYYLYLYLYSNHYFFSIPFVKNFLLFKYDFHTKSLLLKFLFINNFFKIFLNYLKSIFFSFSRVFFKKLKFKGKGYYIFKNLRNTIAFQLGYSHILYIYSFFINVKFLSKTSIFMFGLNYTDILKNSHSFFKLRPINIFTGKGIRFSRQIIYRKTGKITSYR